jgi:RNA polymerase sigma-70 factor (ECF subfamily)
MEIRERAERVVLLDERRLLTRHCQGDERAFAELVLAFRAPVYSYLVRCGVDRVSRDDVLQEIFIKIHGAAASYTPDRPLKPWLFAIVANTVRSHYRKQRVRELVFPDRAAVERAQDPAPNGEDISVARETMSWMEHEIALLPFAQREVVVLACIERLSMEEAGEVLEIPENTVKTLLRRARMTLARQLARRNVRSARETSR